jgi:3-isopropylmalate/(R)-2-methylmalate dehydratase large subunit
MGVPGNNDVVISSGNRNFAGRMGNRNAQVFLASPAAVASAALAGAIVEPLA